MNGIKHTLPKSDRLTSKILITQIYKEGHHINEYPFKIVWKENQMEPRLGLNVVFSVPKRKFKKAVDRNRIKRMLREVYRKNKHTCTEEAVIQNKSISLFIIYIGKEIPSFDTVEDKIKLLLNRLTKEVTN